MNSKSKMTASNTALIVIDVVNSCCHEKCETPELGIRFTKIRETVPKLDKFIDAFRGEFGGKVIFTTLTPWTKECLPDNIKELYENPDVSYYGSGEPFESEFYVVKPKEIDIIIAKNNYDTFSNPQFDEILKKNGIKYLVMTGFFTDGCVLATIASGFSRGYSFVVLKDLVETTDVPVRQELCERLIKYTFPNLYGKTMDSSEFLKGV